MFQTLHLAVTQFKRCIASTQDTSDFKTSNAKEFQRKSHLKRNGPHGHGDIGSFDLGRPSKRKKVEAQAMTPVNVETKDFILPKCKVEPKPILPVKVKIEDFMDMDVDCSIEGSTVWKFWHTLLGLRQPRPCRLACCKGCRDV